MLAEGTYTHPSTILRLGGFFFPHRVRQRWLRKASTFFARVETKRKPSASRAKFPMKRIIIFANGELPDRVKARALIHEHDYLICADGGTRHALALDLVPDLVIGDMDSAEKEQLKNLKENNVPLELFPHDKNETDLELAIQRAIEMNPEQILILAALGGRLDQTLGNIALLADPRLSTLRRGSHRPDALSGGQAFGVQLDDGVEEVLLCRAQVQVHGRSGDLVSLIPWQGPVSEVETKNLKWALHKETLYPDKTRGISNEMTGDTASISVGSGSLLVVHRRV
jgi:thiamine pyrophosphokinase